MASQWRFVLYPFTAGSEQRLPNTASNPNELTKLASFSPSYALMNTTSNQSVSQESLKVL